MLESGLAAPFQWFAGLDEKTRLVIGLFVAAMSARLYFFGVDRSWRFDPPHLQRRVPWRNFHTIISFIGIFYGVQHFVFHQPGTGPVTLVVALSLLFEIPLQERILNARPSPRLKRTHSIFISRVIAGGSRSNWIINCVGVSSVTLMLAPALAETEGGFDTPLIVWINMAVGTLVGYFLIPRALIYMAKSCFVGDVRIAVLRRFIQSPGELPLAVAHAHVVQPIVGGFGYSTYTEDPSLTGADKSPFGETGSALTGAFNAIPIGAPKWREAFDHEFSRSDYAVLDWLAAPTENMRLELELALKHLPPSRIVFFVSPTSAARARQGAKEIAGAQIASSLTMIELRDIPEHWVTSGRAFHSALGEFAKFVGRSKRTDKRPSPASSPLSASAPAQAPPTAS